MLCISSGSVMLPWETGISVVKDSVNPSSVIQKNTSAFQMGHSRPIHSAELAFCLLAPLEIPSSPKPSSALSLMLYSPLQTLCGKGAGLNEKDCELRKLLPARKYPLFYYIRHLSGDWICHFCLLMFTSFSQNFSLLFIQHSLRIYFVAWQCIGCLV